MAVPNFPQPPQRGFSNDSFPGDLISGDRKFYTSISFSQYGLFGSVSFGGNIKLPIPRKLNDNEVMIWEEWSATDAGVSVAAQAGQAMLNARAANAKNMTGSVASSLTSGLIGMAGKGAQIGLGATLNPYMFMMFKRPNFKEFTLQWSLAPTSQRESDSLDQIIKRCKRAALPDIGTVVMEYPELANIKLYAGKSSDKYLFKFKPCAIVSVQVDYTGAGMPSFFKSGAPTIVNLTLQLKETELWSKNDDL